jgi:hypothetical protein
LQQGINAGVHGSPGMGSAGISAARSDPFLISLAQKINDTMESGMVKGGAAAPWAKWRGQYADAAREQAGAKAEDRLRRAFVDENGVPLRGTGPVPESFATLKKTAATLRAPQKGPNQGENIFSKQANQAVSDVVDDLNARGIVDRVTKAASLGNSATSFNLAQMGVMELVGNMFTGIPLLGAGVSLAKSVGQQNIAREKQRILNEILRDPEALREFVNAAAQAAQKIQTGVPVLPYGAVAGGAALAGQQRQQ